MFSVDNVVLKLINGNQESLKDYQHNYKNFYRLIDGLSLAKSEMVIGNLFKMCFALGLFKDYTNWAYEKIKVILTKYPNVLKSFDKVCVGRYKEGFKNLFFEFVLGDLDYYNVNFSYLYNNYEIIKKQIIKAHEQEISNLNTTIKKEKLLKSDTQNLELELNTLKRRLKHITPQEVLVYFNKRIVVRNGDRINEVSDLLLTYVSEEEFERLRILCERAKGVSKLIPFSFDGNDNIVTYKWLESDDPLNLILGYQVKCCAKMDGKGYDIMVQSMVNPKVVNLVILNQDEVIAKATAYYDPDRKYVLFNNAEIKLTKGLKANAERRKLVLGAILRAVKDVVEKFKNQKIKISEIRIGLERNSLLPLIKKFGFEIINDKLLENYPYDGYAGDANSELGQAVLYRDAEASVKNMII